VTAQDQRTTSLSAEAGQVARGSVVNIAAMTIGAALGFGLTVLASRWLQPKAAGEFFELIALFTILSCSFQAGADTGLTRWISRARAVGGLAEVRRIVLIAVVPVLAIGTAGVGAVWLAAPVLARIFLHGMDQGAAAADFRLIAVFVPLGALSACLIAGARGFGRMWPYLGIEGLGKPVLRIGLVALAILAGWGLRGAVLGWSIPVAIGVVASSFVMARLIRKEMPTAVPALSSAGRGGLAAEFWRFEAPRGFAGIFQVIVLWLDILLVGALLNSFDAGIYAAVSRLAMMGTFALEGTRFAIAPQLSGLLARRQHSRAGDLYQSATRLLMLASWPVYLLFAIFPTVVLGIFGARYTAGALSLVIIALAMLVNTGTGNVTVLLLMGGKSSWNVVNTMAALVVNVGLNLVLLPRIGIAGAAIAWAASIVVDNLAAVLEVWWVLGIAPVGRGYGLVVLVAGSCFGLISLAIRIIAGQSLSTLLLALAIGLAVYGPVVYLCRRWLYLTGLYAALRPGRRPSVGASQPARQPGRHRAPLAPVHPRGGRGHPVSGPAMGSGVQPAAQGIRSAHPPAARPVRRSM